MPLTEIQNGTLADCTVVNNNFDYLDDRITDTANRIYTNNAQFESQIATLNGNLSNCLNAINTINSSITAIQNTIQTVQNSINTINSKDDSPDFANSSNWSGSYTCPKDGWAYICVSGYDWRHYATVNTKNVGVSCGYSGGKEVCNGVFVRVSKNDVIGGSGVSGTFYPLKQS